MRRRRFAIIDPRRKSPREEEDADDADADARVDDRRLSGDDDGGNGGVSAVASRMEDGDDNITTTHRTNKVVHEATGRNIVRSLVDVTGLGWGLRTLDGERGSLRCMSKRWTDGKFPCPPPPQKTIIFVGTFWSLDIIIFSFVFFAHHDGSTHTPHILAH
jgi:hypothetical protein